MFASGMEGTVRTDQRVPRLASLRGLRGHLLGRNLPLNEGQPISPTSLGLKIIIRNSHKFSSICG